MCKIVASILYFILWKQSGYGVKAENTNSGLWAEDHFYYLAGMKNGSEEYSCRKQAGNAYLMEPCPFRQSVDDIDRYKFYLVRSLALAYNRGVDGACMVFNKATRDAASMVSESGDNICKPRKPVCANPAQVWIARRSSKEYTKDPIMSKSYHLYNYGKTMKTGSNGTSVCGPSGFCQGKGYVKKFDFDDIDVEYTTFLVDTNESEQWKTFVPCSRQAL